MPIRDGGVLDQNVRLFEVLTEDQQTFVGIGVDLDVEHFSHQFVVALDDTQFDFWLFDNSHGKECLRFKSIMFLSKVFEVIQGLHGLFETEDGRE